MKAGDRRWRPIVASRQRAGDGDRSVGRQQKVAHSRLGCFAFFLRKTDNEFAMCHNTKSELCRVLSHILHIPPDNNDLTFCISGYHPKVSGDNTLCFSLPHTALNKKKH